MQVPCSSLTGQLWIVKTPTRKATESRVWNEWRLLNTTEKYQKPCAHNSPLQLPGTITRQEGLPQEREQSRALTISFTKTKLWYIKHFPNPVGRTAKTSFPLSKYKTAPFSSHCNTNPPKQEADRHSKSKHSLKFLWNWFHSGVSCKMMDVTFCQCSAMLW